MTKNRREDFEYIVHEILRHTKIGPDELMSRIKQKQNELSGFVTPEGAAIMVGRELGVSDVTAVWGKSQIQIKEKSEEMLFLENLFDEFCEYLNGKLRWTETKRKEWTKIILKFFSEKNQAEDIHYIEAKEYMRIDYIWRRDLSRYSSDIELAVEHEHERPEIDVLVNEEIQHLVDIKARNKIAIFYPSSGDEEELIEKTHDRIKAQSIKHPFERYLIILGYPTTKGKKRAILFRGFFFDENGEIESKKDRIIWQAGKAMSTSGGQRPAP